MSKNVRILLLENVENLGKAGDIVTVAEGYARNALFPQGKAALATEQEERSMQTRKKQDERNAEESLAALQEKASQLSGSELSIPARVKEGEGEEIYGSITAAHIARELNRQAHYKVTAADVVIAAPIKSLGTYDCEVRLSSEVSAPIKVAVIPQADRAT